MPDKRKPSTDRRAVSISDTPAAIAGPSGGLIAMIAYWRLFLRYRVRIVAAAVISMIGTLIVTEFCMVHWYEAEAVIRPASQETSSSVSLGGLLSSVAGLQSLGTSSLSNLFGGTAPDAAEHQAMLQSYEVTMAIVDRFNLTYVARRKNWIHQLEALVGLKPYSRYRVFLEMQDLFDCSYDDKEGNLTIDFLAPSPEFAEKVAQGYLDELRLRLRKRAISEAQRAIAALQIEVSRTSDPLLISQLEQLIAQQIQQKSTAEVQADFAFMVIQRPVANDKVYTPAVILVVPIAGFLAAMITLLWLVFRERWLALLELEESTHGGSAITLETIGADSKRQGLEQAGIRQKGAI
jgi:hypothetical protein